MGNEHSLRSIPTRGRTLDHAAFAYDLVEPVFMLGKQPRFIQKIISLLNLEPSHRILDLGCGTGVLTRAIGDRLDARSGGVSIGIDAAGKMIEAARKKRANETCRFEVAAAEALPFENSSFDAVVSTLFFHHLPFDLKAKSLSEANRVLKPDGRLLVADMHSPDSFFGKLISHISRYILMQPEIGENIRGVLPGLIEEAGFNPPEKAATYFGYIAVFTSRKSEMRVQQD
jgi:ubiquinone/menaquinone biosynthesis C-methylase UbiE